MCLIYYFIIILFLIKNLNSQSFYAQILVSPFRVNTQAKYTFNLIPSSLLQLNDYIVISLPPQVGVNSNSMTCSASSTIDPSIALNNCQVIASNTIKVTLNFTTNFATNSLFTVAIDGLVNPKSTNNTYFSNVTIYNLNGELLMNTTSSFSIQPGEISNVNLTSFSQIAGQNTSMNVSFVINQNIISGGSININFPYFNYDNTGAQTLILIYNKYLNITNFNGITPTPLNFNFLTNTISLINPCPNSCLAGLTISFTINNVLNPPSLKNFQGYVISTLDNLNYFLEKSKSASLKISSPALIQVFNLTSNISPNNVNSIVNFQVSYVTPFFIPQGSNIQIQFPNDFQISQQLLTTVSSSLKNASSVSFSFASNDSNFIYLNNISDTYSTPTDLTPNLLTFSLITNPVNKILFYLDFN